MADKEKKVSRLAKYDKNTTFTLTKNVNQIEHHYHIYENKVVPCIYFNDNTELRYITDVFRMKNGELTFNTTKNRDLAGRIQWREAEEILEADKDSDIGFYANRRTTPYYDYSRSQFNW